MSRIDGAHVLITGGTGSLGTALVERLLSGHNGIPRRIVIFSRDELKQAEMRAAHMVCPRLDFQLGDIRNQRRVEEVLQGIDIVFHAAAMKRVEMCERHPEEANDTNANGAANIVSAIRRFNLPVDTVVGVSSDKGCMPVNVYGSTKFLQEKILLAGNATCPNTRFVSVCYGNVMGSRGSVIPAFQQMIADGGPVTVRDPDMTRFLITLPQAVDTLMAALGYAAPGEVYVPIIGAARVGDMAAMLINGSGVEVVITGKGAGEKMHEALITEQDAGKTVQQDGYYVVRTQEHPRPALHGEYVSSDHLLPQRELARLFVEQGYIPPMEVTIEQVT
jgi:UDP-glucose 4-epimerase